MGLLGKPTLLGAAPTKPSGKLTWAGWNIFTRIFQKCMTYWTWVDFSSLRVVSLPEGKVFFGIRLDVREDPPIHPLTSKALMPTCGRFLTLDLWVTNPKVSNMWYV